MLTSSNTKFSNRNIRFIKCSKFAIKKDKVNSLKIAVGKNQKNWQLCYYITNILPVIEKHEKNKHIIRQIRLYQSI